MKLLGIDYGTKNVGIALGDTEHGMAFPKVVLKNSKELISDIEKIVKEVSAEKIVLGESKNYKGEENEVMGEIKEFKKKLEDELGLSVVFEPEFMTSAEAVHLQGKNDMLDASAATIILNSYLQKLSDKNNI